MPTMAAVAPVAIVLQMAWMIVSVTAVRHHLHSHLAKPHHVPNVFAIHVHESVSCQQVIGAALDAAGCEVVFRTNVQTKLASMCSYEIMNSCDHGAAISNAKGVSAYFPVSRVHRPKPVEAAISPPFTHPSEAIHNLTGVLEARYKLGLTGRGIKVAIIDTGVYYLHPALGGGFGPGFKVAFGYDLVGDHYSENTNSTIVPDNDPIDNCSKESHGTHVAGIVAADATDISQPGFVPQFPFTGVAPGVTLGAYRVFGCEGNAGDDVVAAAILRAAEDGADIINLSLGSPGYASNVDAVKSQIATKAGHIVVAAIGNDGSAGAYLASTPGVSFGSLGIASFDNVVAASLALNVDGIPYSYSTGDNGNFTINVPLADELVVNNPHAIAQNVLDDGCTKMNVNVTGKAVLLYWREPDACGSATRCGNAAAAGATACIIYYQSDVLSFTITGSKAIPSLITTLSAGKSIIADLAANKTPIVVPTRNFLNFPSATGGTLSYFSSRGLTNELFLKPDLGGIGGIVYSTISPFAARSQSYPSPYGIYSGTSMASPYVAGCLALLLQKRGKIGFAEARAFLQNTATLTNIYNSTQINTPAYQGAGLVNIYKAAITGTLVIPSSLSLNDTAHRKRVGRIRITNNHDAAVGPVTYILSHIAAATANTFNAGDDFVLDDKTTTFNAKYTAEVRFKRTTRQSQGKQSKGKSGKEGATKNGNHEKRKGGKKNDSKKGEREGSCEKGNRARMLRSSTFSVTINPGTSATVVLDIAAPVPVSSDLWPLFGGYIAIANSFDDLVTHVPYAGVAGVWKDRDVWARNSTSLYTRWALENPSGPFALLGISPTSVGTGLYANSSFTPLKRLDVVNVTDALVLTPAASDSRSANITITDLCNSDTELKAQGLQRTSFVSFWDLTAYFVDNVQPTDSVQSGEMFRNTYTDTLNGATAPHIYGINGTVFTNFDFNTTISLPAGVYQMNFVARKNFGNDDELDIITSPPFQLVYDSPLSTEALANCRALRGKSL